MTSMQFPASSISFASSRLGRYSLPMDFSGMLSAGRKMLLVSLCSGGGSWAGCGPADIPGNGGHSDDDLPVNSPLPCCVFLCNKELHIFLSNSMGNPSSM